jgi:Fe-S cluster assembly protein SufB
MATDLLTSADPIGDINKYDFRTEAKPVFRARKGLDAEIVSQISEMKNEPAWMREFRLKALEIFFQKKMPKWGGDIALDFQDIYYYLKPADHQGKTWEDVPEEIKKTFDRLGIPEAEKKFLSGVKAQFESEVVYGSLKDDLAKKGVIFTDTDTAVREHSDLVREYFATVIPADDNKFAALNSAVWSGGSFIYVPKGVKIDFPLQAYFRINAGPACTTSRAAPPRCIPPRACTPPSSRLSSSAAHAAATRRFRTGPTTSTTSSPSGPWPTPTPRWSGSTATSAAG